MFPIWQSTFVTFFAVFVFMVVAFSNNHHNNVNVMAFSNTKTTLPFKKDTAAIARMLTTATTTTTSTTKTTKFMVKPKSRPSLMPLWSSSSSSSVDDSNSNSNSKDETNMKKETKPASDEFVSMQSSSSSSSSSFSETTPQSSTSPSFAGSSSSSSSSSPPPSQQQLQRQQFRSSSSSPSSSSSLSAKDLMTAMGTNPRRIAISLLSASGIALAGNFLGVTSRLLTTIPEDTVEASGLDTYFPRGDFKRCRGKGYTFVIPKEWVADTFVELAKAQRQVKSLDYSMESSRRRQQQGPITLPDSAYGPPGRLNKNGVSESGDTNVSVIVSTGLSGFSLQGTLGSPTTAAEFLLKTSIAPEGSGRTAILERAIQDSSNRNVYQLEFVVDRGVPRLPKIRNISVIAANPKGDKLYTLTVVAPLQSWEEDPNYAMKLRKIAESFHLVES